MDLTKRELELTSEIERLKQELQTVQGESAKLNALNENLQEEIQKKVS